MLIQFLLALLVYVLVGTYTNSMRLAFVSGAVVFTLVGISILLERIVNILIVVNNNLGTTIRVLSKLREQSKGD
jgi:uncharacterized integral membrane protein